jgi:hypothetical protein
MRTSSTCRPSGPIGYSLNAVRPAAIHAAFGFLLWHRRKVGGDGPWSVPESDPGVTALLEARLDLQRESSRAVRSTFGWWLPLMLRLDRDWAQTLADRIDPSELIQLIGFSNNSW